MCVIHCVDSNLIAFGMSLAQCIMLKKIDGIEFNSSTSDKSAHQPHRAHQVTLGTLSQLLLQYTKQFSHTRICHFVACRNALLRKLKNLSSEQLINKTENMSVWNLRQSIESSLILLRSIPLGVIVLCSISIRSAEKNII